MAPVSPPTDISAETVESTESNGDRSTSPTSNRNAPSKSLELFLTKTSDALEKMRRIEGRVAADQDLKLSDMLRYRNAQIS